MKAIDAINHQPKETQVMYRIARYFATAAGMALVLLLVATPARAADYELKYIKAPLGADASADGTCRVWRDGEFLAEFATYHCQRYWAADVPGNYLLLTLYSNYDRFIENDDMVVFAFDKSSGSVTDSLKALYHLATVLDGETPIVITEYKKYNLPTKFPYIDAYIPDVHALVDGRFVETATSNYYPWRASAEGTAEIITAIVLNQQGIECTGDACTQMYDRACAQLQEIFKLSGLQNVSPDSFSDSEYRFQGEAPNEERAWGCAACRQVASGQLPVLTSWPKFWEGICRSCELGSESQIKNEIPRRLRKNTHALYDATGLTTLYKQGRHHVMENGVLLWSSRKMPPARQFDIVRAPDGHLLFILTRTADRLEPGDTVVWTYNPAKQAITDMRLMTSIDQIEFDDDKLVLTEIRRPDGFDHPRAPQRPWLHILSKGHWTEDDALNYGFGKYRLFSLRIADFISRIHLECGGKMNGCSRAGEFKKAIKLLDAAYTQMNNKRWKLFDGKPSELK
ncbi:MAG: hypothetical protein K8963_10710, partial [Proteobacteria bacterium]|nr:hypothetical protein [Pseudomonadota bacterium]